MDCIHLKEIRCYGYTGALPEEQVLGQWFEVDVSLWLDLSLAGQSDRLSDTLDYCNVIAVVKQRVQTARYMLLERLASAIAEAILQFQPVNQVNVRLTKCAAPIPDFGGKIIIEMTRQKINLSPTSGRG
ncbi:MAG: dihydroneopterin aldolase [Scytolyngbya sp. HA4215-MV1]|jgi:dihydroneopterin aldolase|nr:dihydroneopterin aldolase [Scytolyngbya sp. HA4215-MV1]